MKIFNFLFTLFGNNFISQESPILADFENINSSILKHNIIEGIHTIIKKNSIFQLF